MSTPHNKLPLGGPAWLRAIAAEKEEMNHALPSMNAEHRNLDAREVQGLRDAADRIERLEKAGEALIKACPHEGEGKQRALAAMDMRAALES